MYKIPILPIAWPRIVRVSVKCIVYVSWWYQWCINGVTFMYQIVRYKHNVSRYIHDTCVIHVRYNVSRLRIHTGRYLCPWGKLEPMEAWLWRQTRPPTMPEVRHEEDHLLRCIDHLLRYSIRDVSSVYRNGIEKRYSIEVPTAPRTYRACIERVSNKKCLDTVSRGVYRKSRYTYDTLRSHFDTFMGKMHPDTWGKRPYRTHY